ncbi:unnamed protein product [Lasius platythorax]|uniref:Uncharacterized protein n=1 Tax=Lasius platythorax TaxID=488582 RepID=A0AAV2N7G3_9HYME
MTSGSRHIILRRIAEVTRRVRRSNSEPSRPQIIRIPRLTPEPANSFVKSFCEFTALVTSTLSPTVFPSWDRRRPDLYAGASAAEGLQPSTKGSVGDDGSAGKSRKGRRR